MSDVDAAVLVAFGLRLTAVRVRLNITQDTLAELADLDRSYISLLERGKRNPSLVCLANLARALNVNIARLCYFAGSEIA